MKKTLALLLALAVLFAFAACNQSAPAEPEEVAEEPVEEVVEEAAEPEEPAAEPIPAGEYHYYEDKGDFGINPWIVTLNEDGTAVVAEENPFLGLKEHATDWTDNGDGTFTTGAWEDPDGPKSDFFGEDGSADWELVELNGETFCQPLNGPATADGPSEEPSGEPIAAGEYHYYEDKGDFGINPWIVTLNEDGTAVVAEENPFLGLKEHATDWTDNGDGTFSTGAWEDPDGPKSDFFGEDGSADWELVEVNSETLCQPLNGPATADGPSEEPAE